MYIGDDYYHCGRYGAYIVGLFLRCYFGHSK
jgi:hypothetical protein